MAATYHESDVDKIHPIFTVERAPMFEEYKPGEENSLQFSFCHSIHHDIDDAMAIVDFGRTYVADSHGDPHLLFQISIVDVVETFCEREEHHNPSDKAARAALRRELKEALAILEESIQGE